MIKKSIACITCFIIQLFSSQEKLLHFFSKLGIFSTQHFWLSAIHLDTQDFQHGVRRPVKDLAKTRLQNNLQEVETLRRKIKKKSKKTNPLYALSLSFSFSFFSLRNGDQDITKENTTSLEMKPGRESTSFSSTLPNLDLKQFLIMLLPS